MLPFISFDYRVFQKLRYEALRVTCAISSGSDAVVRVLLDEGLLRRIKLAMVDSIVSSEEFSVIVITMGNISGSSKINEIVSKVISSGVMQNILVDTHRYYENREVIENLCFLFSNFMRAINYEKNFDYKSFVSEMYNCINSVSSPSEKTISDLVWGTAMFLDSKKDASKHVEHLHSLNVISDLLDHYLHGAYTKELDAPYSRILSCFSYHFELCGEYLSQDVIKVIPSLMKKVISKLDSLDPGIRLSYYRTLNHLLCSPQAQELMEQYLNPVCCLGLIKLLGKDCHDSQCEILEVIHHILVVFRRRVVLDILQATDSVRSLILTQLLLTTLFGMLDRRTSSRQVLLVLANIRDMVYISKQVDLDSLAEVISTDFRMILETAAEHHRDQSAGLLVDEILRICEGL